jgi:hypothetical protein
MPSSSDFFYNSPAVAIVVGAKGKARTFYIHKTLVVDHLKYFATRLNCSFREGKTGPAMLGGDDPIEFDVFA